MELAPRIEFLEIGTGRHSSAPTFFQNLTRTKYAGLNFGCGGRSGLSSWRRRGGGRGGGDHGGEGRGGGGLRGGGVAAAGSAGAAAAETAAGVVQTYKYPGLNYPI